MDHAFHFLVREAIGRFHLYRLGLAGADIAGKTVTFRMPFASIMNVTSTGDTGRKRRDL